jgi:glycosyltransferase involved in cell wall biosynthesis
MAETSVRLDIVGEMQIDIPASSKNDARIILYGAVPRSSVADYYRDTDLFLFPTHSDGFGLTQLEALAHGAPVLASRHCGDVIAHGVNGFVLDRVAADAIELVLREILNEPSRLQACIDRVEMPPGFTMRALAANLPLLTE